MKELNKPNICQMTQLMLQDTITGNLSKEQQIEIQEHITICQICRLQQAKLKADIDSWRENSYQTKALTIAEILENSRKKKLRTKRQLTTATLFAAASLGFGIAIGIALDPSTPPNTLFETFSEDYSLSFASDEVFPVEFFNE
jgi:predicted anti-sigma-YlaC factor YlaD